MQKDIVAVGLYPRVVAHHVLYIRGYGGWCAALPACQEARLSEAMHEAGYRADKKAAFAALRESSQRVNGNLNLTHFGVESATWN